VICKKRAQGSIPFCVSFLIRFCAFILQKKFEFSLPIDGEEIRTFQALPAKKNTPDGVFFSE